MAIITHQLPATSNIATTLRFNTTSQQFIATQINTTLLLHHLFSDRLKPFSLKCKHPNTEISDSAILSSDSHLLYRRCFGTAPPAMAVFIDKGITGKTDTLEASC
ncbi:hypothetical protein DCAR_0727876 [Daucus carota subsp. sativus]|uniref:Uncharacterized protein n=1 Tax=Daucus carota subsp. sativus TaxID=79200 RepID=A0A161ZK53_DAUCS|nr:hypothetical protein DCAR_0727876 [Daucus carota subsp. sativus]